MFKRHWRFDIVLGISQQRLAGAEIVADATSTAAFLLVSDGRVVYANAAAESLMRNGISLALQNSYLTSPAVQSQVALRQLLESMLADCSMSRTPAPAMALSLPRASDGQLLQLLACPLSAAHRRRSGADLLLLVTDSKKTVRFPHDVLRALYSLTPAETEVANRLLMDHSVDEIASLRHVSVGTVRNQLKSILSKTTTGSQANLLRLLMALPQPPVEN